MNLFDIIEKEKWRRMQEGFAKALGVYIETLDLKGNPFPGINTPNPFCFDIIKFLYKDAKREYERCIFNIISKIKEDKDDNCYICPLGLHLYGVPIQVQKEETLAYVIIGPVLLQRKKDISEYRKFAKKRNIPLNYLVDKLSSLKRFSFVGIEAAVELVREVANDIAQLNYNTKKLKERFDMPRTLDSLIRDLYSSVYFEDLLSALLDASIHTAKGNAGSIMLLDQDKNELTVKFSRGLKADVAESAKVKVGEGISGIVAKKKKPLLIDDSIKDIKIKNRLKRPYIKSSIVYPLEVKNRLFGVLNLNNIDKKRRFNSETLDLIGSLTRLTKVALALFPKNSTFLPNAC